MNASTIVRAIVMLALFGLVALLAARFVARFGGSAAKSLPI